MTKIDKKYIYIDAQQQHKEKNIALQDYSVFNIKTGRQLKHRFWYYFKDLEDYFGSKNSDYKNWDKEYRYTSQEAAIFLNNIRENEIRIWEEF